MIYSNNGVGWMFQGSEVVATPAKLYIVFILMFIEPELISYVKVLCYNRNISQKKNRRNRMFQGFLMSKTNMVKFLGFFFILCHFSSFMTSW